MTPQYDLITDPCPCEQQGRCLRCGGTGQLITRVKLSDTNQQARESELVVSNPAGGSMKIAVTADVIP